jgi:TrmH family RNA methyltransferase
VPAPSIPSLTNPRSDRVKAVRALSGRSARLRTGRYLVEGPQAVREAVRFRPSDVVDLYLTPSAAERYREIVDAARGADRHVHLATAEVLETMSADAQGVVAVAADRRPTPGPQSLALLREVVADRPRLVAVLSHVRDPGNAGTVIRAADAAGAELVVLTESSVDVTNPKVVRSTAGSLFHLPVVTGVALADVVGVLREAGLDVLAADGAGTVMLDDLLAAAGAVGSHAPGDHGVRSTAEDRHGAASPRALHPDLARPTAWVFGNEAWGLTDDERALADVVVRVPIHGHAESLNLGTAATVCLYASAFAQR